MSNVFGPSPPAECPIPLMKAMPADEEPSRRRTPAFSVSQSAHLRGDHFTAHVGRTASLHGPRSPLTKERSRRCPSPCQRHQRSSRCFRDLEFKAHL
jgi:hypothetical protein